MSADKGPALPVLAVLETRCAHPRCGKVGAARSAITGLAADGCALATQRVIHGQGGTTIEVTPPPFGCPHLRARTREEWAALDGTEKTQGAAAGPAAVLAVLKAPAAPRRRA